MNELFSGIYEFGGILPFYSADLGEHLRGFDITCSNYIGTLWYTYVGLIMLGITMLSYALLYHVIDSPRFARRRHWWITALIICVLNFVFAFTVTLNSVHSPDHCKQLHISSGDVVGFGIDNALISLLFFIVVTSIPYIRYFSTNCKYTTFWKP